jgi:hypothetical protein
MIQMSEEANGFEDRKSDVKKREKRGIFSRTTSNGIFKYFLFSLHLFSMGFRVISFCLFFAVEILELDMQFNSMVTNCELYSNSFIQWLIYTIHNQIILSNGTA